MQPRLLETMTPDEIKHYMNLLCQATEAVVPADGKFAMIVFGPDGMAHWVTNVAKDPKILRALAADITRAAREMEMGS